MIPRLQPRPSSRRLAGIENVFPVNGNNNVNTNISPDVTTRSTSLSDYTGRSGFSDRLLSSSNDGTLLSKENALSSKGMTSQDKQPLSPSQSTQAYDQPANSPVPNHYGDQYKHLLLSYSSSTSNSFETDNSSMSYIDFSLTPPTSGSRPPLLVSAKRHGNEVRRQHNKCRRRRRRPISTRSNLQNNPSILSNAVSKTDGDCCKENDNDALCLWKGDSLEADNNYLPLLASSDEEEEQTDRIEEVVRAEHLKEAMVARGNEKLKFKKRSFSAHRAPPPKGCLSNPRPKRPRGYAARYKTPPKSTDELSALSESNAHQPRRVQFGIPSAVEYEIDRPPDHLTPMSQEVTSKRYSMNPKEPTREENEITQETRQNNSILSEWEDQFANMRSNRNRSRDRSRNGSSSKRNRRNRRSSSIFSPATNISLGYDCANQTNRDAKEKDDALSSDASDSKSATITANSASLNMFGSRLSLEETSSDATSQTTPIHTTRTADDNQTWDFVADFGLINSKGAMELSPHSTSSKTKEPACKSVTSAIKNACNTIMPIENTPSPTDVNLDAINAFGTASDNDSQNRLRTVPDDNSNGDSSLFLGEGLHNNSTKVISKILITTPWLDQEWDFVSLLRNLSHFKMKEVAVERCLSLLDPCIHNALCCTSAFVEQAMRTLSLKSTLPRNVPNKNDSFSAKRKIISEWKEIEISFIENLTNMLDQFRLEMENACDFEYINKHLLFNDCPSNSRSENERVENVNSKLQNDINQHKLSLDIIDASIAPFSCILCQAASKIGIYGFYFKELRDDHILELDYVHSTFGVKTRVIIDIDSQPGFSIDYCDGASNREQNSLLDIHRQYVHMLKGGKMSFELNCNELQDSLLRLGQILGKLDQCVFSLKAINGKRKATITVDLPHIRLTFPAEGKIVSLTLDLEKFVTKIITISTIDGSSSEGRIEIPSSVDCCNLESLDRILPYAQNEDVAVVDESI